MIELNSEKFENEIKDGVVVVDCFTFWCGPCRMMLKVLDTLSSKVEEKICKIDVEQAPDIATKYGIVNVPTILFFKDGILKEKLTGMQSEASMISTIEKVKGM